MLLEVQTPAASCQYQPDVLLPQARAIEDGIYSVECQLYAAKADLELTAAPASPGKPVLQLRICAWSCAEQPAAAAPEEVCVF